jgi:hypothetical protein
VPVLVDDADRSVLVTVGLRQFPFSLIVDDDGTVVARFSGGVDVASLVAFTETLG